MENGISLGTGILWSFIWFGFMLLYTALHSAVWKKIRVYGKYLNLLSILLCMLVFVRLLVRANSFQLEIFEGVSPQGILLAIGTAILFYFLLDKGLDPLFEKFFPASEESYQETLRSLSAAPVISGLHVCVLAPILEEILMRGFLLSGLSVSYGKATALFVSAFLFALLHFNMVQTFSAFICGMALGLLYFYTGSLFCCMLAHIGYNLISYVGMTVPLYRK